MQAFMRQTMILCFVVDFLLLLGTNRLCGFPMDTWLAALAALYGSIYCGACFLPSTEFLRGFFWRFTSLVFMSILAFGFTRSAIHRGVVFILLHMAINGIIQSQGEQGIRSVVLAVSGVFLLCVIGFREKQGQQLYVPVELSYGDKRVELTALRDTGNGLRDPVTGKPVLIVDAATAEGLTGLSRQQLCCPVETMGIIPGLRLIPYKTVGGAGLLLALRLSNVKIGSWQGSGLVAFSPEILSSEGIYQALTGGML